jgi:hypothetical protein
LRAAAAAADRAARWRRAEAAANTYGVNRLARLLARNVEQVSNANIERLERLRREAVVGDERVARRLSKAREEFRSRIAKQIAIERAAVDTLARRDLWDKIAIASSLPLFAAYGERGNPFGSRNLALLVSLLIWLVGDEVRDALFGSEERSPYGVREMDTWSYLAPAFNVLAGWWLMSGYQHERFVMGLTSEFVPLPPEFIGGNKVRHAYVGTVHLERLMAPASFAEFAAFDEAAAVVTTRELKLSPAGVVANATVENVSAVERGGHLEIRVVILADDPGVNPPPAVVDSIDMAFLVDTHKPDSPSR